MHAAHRGTEDQAQMVYSESLLQHFSLQRNHVVVVVLWKVSVQAVARLGGFSVADVIRQNYVIACDVEQLPRPE